MTDVPSTPDAPTSDRKGIAFTPIPEAIERFRAGEMVIIVDDEDRENEGDLVIAAERVTPDAINFMAKHGRGLICLSLTEERCRELALPLMVDESSMTPFGTAFTVSIEARGKVTTGISASDRAATVRTAIDPATQPRDLARPGHIFPVRARPGGVLKRAGHTEASSDLAALAGFHPAGVICEIMNDDGTMARVPDLAVFARRHGLAILTVSDLIRHRMRHETLVERIASPRLKTPYGEFTAHGYRSAVTGEEHVAFTLGDIEPDVPVLVRVHSQDLLGDLFGPAGVVGGSPVHRALRRIADEGRGVLLYLLQETGGPGFLHKLRALEQSATELSADASAARRDERNYGIGSQILRDLGVRKMRLITDNVGKYVAIDGYGLEIVERLALELEDGDASSGQILRWSDGGAGR
ncbi:MAG: 3,4-dihydroxy-2-butanone-4-phosphate synthase [Acidobacteriota bacterium]